MMVTAEDAKKARHRWMQINAEKADSMLLSKINGEKL